MLIAILDAPPLDDSVPAVTVTVRPRTARTILSITPPCSWASTLGDEVEHQQRLPDQREHDERERVQRATASGGLLGVEGDPGDGQGPEHRQERGDERREGEQGRAGSSQSGVVSVRRERAERDPEERPRTILHRLRYAASAPRGVAAAAPRDRSYAVDLALRRIATRFAPSDPRASCSRHWSRETVSTARRADRWCAHRGDDAGDGRVHRTWIALNVSFLDIAGVALWLRYFAHDRARACSSSQLRRAAPRRSRDRRRRAPCLRPGRGGGSFSAGRRDARTHPERSGCPWSSCVLSARRRSPAEQRGARVQLARAGRRRCARARPSRCCQRTTPPSRVDAAVDAELASPQCGGKSCARTEVRRHVTSRSILPATSSASSNAPASGAAPTRPLGPVRTRGIGRRPVFGTR